MDTQLVIEEYDSFIALKRFREGGKFLELAAEAARNENDLEADAIITGELIGHYRKNGVKTKCLKAIRYAKRLLKSSVTDDGVMVGTLYINMATGCTHFGYPNEAIEYFEIAEKYYRENLPVRDKRWSGLYNNSAAAFEAAGDLDRAEEGYLRALRFTEAIDAAEESAITCINLAGLAGKREQQQKIDKYLDRALYALSTVRNPGAYHAYVCRQLAVSFACCGRNKDEEALLNKAVAIEEKIAREATRKESR